MSKFQTVYVQHAEALFLYYTCRKISKYCGVCCQLQLGTTPLFLAITKNKYETVQLLLDRGGAAAANATRVCCFACCIARKKIYRRV